ncbi:MAG: hypothetical protein KGR69_05890, partial [Verrucomicrobia bacterium]|nr:hypothetical protein [Verrucomicrobiota bacterium]
KTGGLGLRSAIKVVQEVLVEGNAGRPPLAEAEAGTLANTVTFYDSLRRDIQGSFGHIVDGVERVAQRLPKDTVCQDVAKSIAVLQILENLPVTIANVAALLQPSVKSPSAKESVEKAVETLLSDTHIPLGEKDGSLRFLTQTSVTLQKRFDDIEFRNTDVKAELNGVLRSLFKPLPSTRLSGARPVTAGLRVVVGGGQSVALDGEKEPVQLHVEFAPASSYDATRTERENDSRSSKERTHLYLLGRAGSDSDSLAVVIVKCRKFLDAHRTATDPDTQEFVRIIESRLERTVAELERKLTHALFGGSFIAHGGHEAVSTHGTELLEAAKSFLGQAAAKIYDRYPEAPVQADSGLAEKFLKTPLDRITTNEDPLGLITRAGGQPRINTAHRALVSITDYLGQNGQVEGRRLGDHFLAPPYGWSPDTLRYLLAAAFLATEIKLRIAGKDHQVKSDEALAAFASNKAFGPVGVSLREEKVDPDALMRASQRFTSLTGDTVLPLEDEIAASAKRHFPTYQAAFGPLGVELRNFGLPMETADRADKLVEDLIEVISGDGSDAVKRLGGADSPLYDDLVWARALKKQLDQGLRLRLSHLNRLRREIESLPDSGLPGQLKQNAAEPLATVDELLARDAFFEEGASLAANSNLIDSLVAATVTDLAGQQDQLKLETLERWQSSPDWEVLGEEDRTWLSSAVAGLTCAAGHDLDGLKTLLNHDFTLNHRLRDLGDEFRRRADAIRKERDKPVPPPPTPEDLPKPELEVKTVYLPRHLGSVREVQDLIDQLTEHLRALKAGASIRIECKVFEEKQP